MPLQFHNTISKKVEPFVPLDPDNKAVSLYTCGPTVYNYAHIGNFRAYLFGDVLKRTLGYCGYDVHHVMNITDIDDKTIRDSQVENKSLKEFTEFYTEAFFADRDALNIIPAQEYPRATEYVSQMITMIEKLIATGHAYKEEDGSVYFKIDSFSNYGALSHINLASLKENASGRIKSDEYEKDNLQDFALWKAWDSADGEVFWDSPFGKGRPGWHIECSAMSTNLLGNSIDIHTGGVDNIFPHHENEIAQSECSTNAKFVNYWLHNEWVMVEGKKMAKSAGNFTTLRTIIDRNINPLAFRLLTLMSHYRSPLNFTWEALEGAETALKRLYSQFLDLDGGGIVDDKYKAKFTAYIEDDLNTPMAVATMWDLLKDEEVPSVDKRETLLDFDKVLGLGLATLKHEHIPEEIHALANARELAREEKDWARSDELRIEIESAGYYVKDTDKGPIVVKK